MSLGDDHAQATREALASYDPQEPDNDVMGYSPDNSVTDYSDTQEVPEVAYQRAILAELMQLSERLDKIEAVINSQSASVNWLTENTAGLFSAFKDMMANGGPAALMPSLLGGKKNG